VVRVPLFPDGVLRSPRWRRVLLATRVLAVKSPVAVAVATLTAALFSTVHQTLEPAHVSVWISGAAPRTGPGADGADGAGRMPT
jgi:hypothetical protein